MMKTLPRRSFIKKTFSGIAGSSLLLSGTKNSLLAKAETLGCDLFSNEDSENYWEVVKNHFSLSAGLYYFNNASLGPSPELVIDATEKFRRTLESFPSKYMWGEWAKDKEEVRKKTAEMLGAAPEEIALIHNTTEGMNIVAKSLDLQSGDEIIVADHEHPSGTIPWIYWQESKGVKLVRPKLLGLGTAIDFHNLITPAKRERRIYDLKKYFREKLANKPHFKIKTPKNDDLSAGISTVELNNKNVRDVEKILTKNYSVNCRPMSSFGLNGLRISLSIFNTKSEIDYLINSLEEIYKKS